MKSRQLGRSGLRISSLTLGTMTFGGRGEFQGVGETDLEGARRQIDMALDAGVNVIDTADVYSAGAAGEIVGEALEGKHPPFEAGPTCWRRILPLRRVFSGC